MKAYSPMVSNGTPAIAAEAASLRTDVYQNPINICLNAPSVVVPMKYIKQKIKKPTVIHRYFLLKKVNIIPMATKPTVIHCAGLSANERVIIHSSAGNFPIHEGHTNEVTLFSKGQ